MNVKNYVNDELDYYDIDTNKGTLTFDTSMGPEFKIDYKNNKLVECSSDGAKLLECYIQGI